jgi:predicted DNA-binding protein
MKFPKVGEFTLEDLTDWLDDLDIYWSAAIIEKLYKDMRDYAFAHEEEKRLRQHEE